MKFFIILALQLLTVAALYLAPLATMYVTTGLSVVFALTSLFGLFQPATPYAHSLIASAKADTLDPWKASVLSLLGRGLNIAFLYFLLSYQSPVLLGLYAVSTLVIHANLGRERAFRQRMIRNAYGYAK